MRRLFSNHFLANRFFANCAAITMACVCFAGLLLAQELRVPASISAGDEISISTTGSGKASFYLTGPGVSLKSEVELGSEIHLPARDLQIAGAYLAVLCSSACKTTRFYVTAARPASVAFLVHPSRVPVGRDDAVSGVALPFDRFHNLVRTPVSANFQIISGSTTLFSKSAETQDGVAWFRTASGKSAGAVQVTASIEDVSAKRAVQQVASDPCNLRIKGGRTKTGIEVETEPVRDCAGNIVPDGTIVTFTATDSRGKDTVDAPIKKGVARAEMQAPGAAVISVASGVVMGNELRIGRQP